VIDNDRIALASSSKEKGEGQPKDGERHDGSAKVKKSSQLQDKSKNVAIKSNGNKRTYNNSYNRNKAGEIFAALDLGTNNCRLLVARAQGNGFRVIDGFSRIVRLGEGVSNSGLLDEKAMERTKQALKECLIKIDRHQPKKMRLIATEACRAAANSKKFLKDVQTELGLELEIIDQRTEAELAVVGCCDLIEEKADGALMFDIGGGSSELAWLDFRGGRPKSRGKMAASIRSWQSLPVGVVSIAEKFDGKNVTPESFEEMVAYVSQKLKAFKGRKKLQEMIKTHDVHLIGTSGTVTTLAGLHLGLERYDRSKVDGLWMRNEEVVDTMRVLLNMPYERRKANPCIGEDRADLVIPGCAIFEAIRREWTTKRIRVADRGLREGMLVSMIEVDRKQPRTKNRSKRNNNIGQKSNG
jgi:exopolyphosphatase/guanosine-5'-triphosphate,3'-diphosphate pyrophosphatase